MRTLACVCIHLTCIWAEYEIPQSAAGAQRPWYSFVDSELTEPLLLDLANQFSVICATSDKSHVHKRMSEKQAGASGSGRRSISNTTVGAASNTTITPSRSTTPKLPPPPAPPSLPTPATPVLKKSPEKRKLEQSEKSNGSLMSSSKIKKELRQATVKREVKQESADNWTPNTSESSFVDEWSTSQSVTQTSVVKEESLLQAPLKQKKLAVSEYMERRKEERNQATTANSTPVLSANGAMSTSSDGGASSEAEVAAHVVSTAKMGLGVNSPSVPAVEERRPRQSFMPDISKASELVSADTMQLPAGIPMARPEKKPSEKRRDSNSSSSSSKQVTAGEKPHHHHTSSSSSHRPRPSSSQPASHHPHKPAKYSMGHANGGDQQPQHLQQSSSASLQAQRKPQQTVTTQRHPVPSTSSSYKHQHQARPLNDSPDPLASNKFQKQPAYQHSDQLSNNFANAPVPTHKEHHRHHAYPQHAQSSIPPPQPTGYQSPPSPAFESLSPPQPVPNYSTGISQPPYPQPYQQPRMMPRPPPPPQPQRPRPHPSYHNELEDGELA